jgi:hypothetical protein
VRLATAIRLIPCVALVLTSAPAARADGVHTDPNSPTSKEYAIPLDSARHAAASGGGGGSVSSQSSTSSSSSGTTTQAAPLFGVGVRSTSTSRAHHARKHRSHHGGSSKGSPQIAVGIPDKPSPPPHLAAATNTPGGGITTPVLIGGLAAIALLIGGVGGLAVRRRLA